MLEESIEKLTVAIDALCEVMQKLATGTPSTSAPPDDTFDEPETAAQKKKRVAAEKKAAREAKKAEASGDKITDEQIKKICSTAIKSCGGDRALATKNVKQKISDLGKGGAIGELSQAARKELTEWVGEADLLKAEEEDFDL